MVPREPHADIEAVARGRLDRLAERPQAEPGITSDATGPAFARAGFSRPANLGRSASNRKPLSRASPTSPGHRWPGLDPGPGQTRHSSPGGASARPAVGAGLTLILPGLPAANQAHEADPPPGTMPVRMAESSGIRLGASFGDPQTQSPRPAAIAVFGPDQVRPSDAPNPDCPRTARNHRPEAATAGQRLRDDLQAAAGMDHSVAFPGAELALQAACPRQPL